MHKTSIIIQFQLPGFHYWPDAPIKFKYLSFLHRHVFHFCITIDVEHGYRQIEFIDLKKQIIKQIEEKYYNAVGDLSFSDYSCELIAMKTYELIKQKLNIHCSEIRVLEDGENGAIIKFEE